MIEREDDLVVSVEPRNDGGGVVRASPLSCPICGNRAMLLSSPYNSVWCVTDGCLRMPPRASADEAIAAWNRRAPNTNAFLAGYEAGQRGDGLDHALDSYIATPLGDAPATDRNPHQEDTTHDTD